LPAGHLSWTMGVVGVDKGYYPVDFDGIAEKKSGGKGQYKFGREKVGMNSVMKRGGDRDIVIVILHLWSMPYCTDLSTLDDIRRLLELERVVVDRTIKSQTVSLNPNQVLTKELSPDMKQWEELILENVYGLGGHRDRLPTCLAHMLYCVVAEEQYNLAYFFVKRIECAKATPTVNLPYGIDRGKARRSVSSSSSRHQGTSSHQHDDDDDVETSRASTPSPTTYLNSLHPLDYQNYHVPSSFEQTDETLFARQTTLLN
nr:ribosomal protein L7Ae/L30e/S12e/Gadd45 [Tanacetum cinerariifolium]